MRMLKYTLQKVLIAIVTMFILATLTFFLMKLIPGDPFARESVKPYVHEIQVKYYGLDKPNWQQYLTYMGNLLHGDFGTSLTKNGRSVWTIITETFPVSAKLGLIATFFGEIIGILFGAICAQNRGKLPDFLLMIVAILGVALPSMVLGPLIRFFFGVKLKLLPVTGWGGWKEIVMPATCLALGDIAGMTRSMRASMLKVSTEDYIKTARAKGLNNAEVIFRHELKNSLIPTMTNLGTNIAGIMMGSFVIEQIFLIPGLGKYFVDSITSLDYPVIMGTTIFYGGVLVSLNLLVDIAFGFIDPRIRVD